MSYSITDGHRKPYFASSLRDHAAAYGDLAPNVYAADLQGTDPRDFFRFRRVLLRTGPVQWGGTTAVLPDDWQRIHILRPSWLADIPRGAYADFAGSRWIVFKSRGIGALAGTAVLRRCNAVFTLPPCPCAGREEVEVPFSFVDSSDISGARGTLGAQSTELLSDALTNCICQRNEVTSALQEGSTVLLAGQEWTVRGLTDFARDFTFDPSSTHLCSFRLQRRRLSLAGGKVLV